MFAHFSKQFVMLPPINFSTSNLRVSIAMWQLTILLVLKPISAWSFLIQNSFNSSLVCGDFCIGFSRWIVSAVLPMYLGNCTVGCYCGQPRVFWLACRFLEFHGIFALLKDVVCLRIEFLQTIMFSLRLF